MKGYQISSILRYALNAYKDWKHPYYLFDNPKDKQTAKEAYLRNKKLYKELKGKYPNA